ncbi:hypothetical protein K474DRAFT_1661246 [Panus rudis PR-1116 ss-1]|nr:hypothetical protein K474DRAFT_1661246 [Panus rudis PR-1116 ss-1]
MHLAIVALIPLGYRGLTRQFPARKFKELNKEFNETRDYFHTVLEEGLLPHAFVQRCRTQLDDWHLDVERLRADACSAVTFREQCVALYNGLSRKIDWRRREVADLQATIVSTSEKQRQRLAEQRRKLGGRSIFGVRKSSELEMFRDLYYGKFDVSLPNQPSSIHNDIAISRVASVRRHSDLVADTVGKQPFSVDKFFLDGNQDPATMFSEPTPIPSSRPTISETPASLPIQANALALHPATSSSIIDACAAAKADKHVSSTPSSLSANTLTPSDPEEVAALVSQLGALQQQLNAVTYLAQQVQERQRLASTKQ